ncbi:uncharacterized protein At2g39920 isoform X2 [Apium graveolens]|uniref:uncharacterized protein At2g39920 isoform X2 n=1 Tax=Apium graveolens TaxID=4045 RepID=UPI003D7957AF
MSVYDQQMERQYSAQSLSSSVDSDTDISSDYAVESGIYMTSCAATILVAGLVSLGAVLMIVLISLTVMLQSCQTKSAGAFKSSNPVDDYSDCKIFALNAEFNSLDARSVPSFCRDVAIKYIEQGQYMRDLETTSLLAENYLNNIKPLADVLDVVLMDIDDFVPIYSHYFSPLLPGIRGYIYNDYVEEAKEQKKSIFLKLYMKLQAGGWPLVLFSRKPEKLRSTAFEHLISAGCGNWSSLVMRGRNANAYPRLYLQAKESIATTRLPDQGSN